MLIGNDVGDCSTYIAPPSSLPKPLPSPSPPGTHSPSPHAILYCERFVEWLIDVLSQLPTRRLVHALLRDKAVLVKAKLSSLYTHPSGRLFVQLVDLLQFYDYFPINDHTGEALGEEDVTAEHYDKLQQVCVCVVCRCVFGRGGY